MTGGSAQASCDWFTAPQQVNQRRYEALRAFYVDGLTHAQAGARFGYTRWAMVNLVREHRAGRLELFAPPGRPGPKPGVAPAKDRARGRIIELRRQGLSTYEISRKLASEATPLNRTSVAEILTEEGFGRLLRHPEPAASISAATPGRDTHLPRTAKLDFTAWPTSVDTGKAGLLLLVPDLIALDLPGLVAEIIGAFHADALSSTVNLNVDLDIMLCVLAQALTAALRARLPGYTRVTPDVLQRRFLETPGKITTTADTITVHLDRRAYSPILRTAGLPNDTVVPWWANRTLRYEIT